MTKGLIIIFSILLLFYVFMLGYHSGKAFNEAISYEQFYNTIFVNERI